jgi:hypothetical protein
MQPVGGRPVQQKSRTETPTLLRCSIRTAGNISDGAIASWISLRVNALFTSNNKIESEVHGYLPDRSALMDVVIHLRNLGYTILSVECNSLCCPSESGAG